MGLTVKGIHLLAWLSRDRDLYAECKGADLDALQDLGLLEWFDVLYRRHQLSLHGPSRAALLWLAERINALVQPTIRMS